MGTEYIHWKYAGGAQYQGCWNLGYPYKIYLKLKSHELSFAHILSFLSCTRWIGWADNGLKL